MLFCRRNKKNKESSKNMQSWAVERVKNIVDNCMIYRTFWLGIEVLMVWWKQGRSKRFFCFEFSRNFPHLIKTNDIKIQRLSVLGELLRRIAEFTLFAWTCLGNRQFPIGIKEIHFSEWWFTAANNLRWGTRTLCSHRHSNAFCSRYERPAPTLKQYGSSDFYSVGPTAIGISLYCVYFVHDNRAVSYRWFGSSPIYKDIRWSGRGAPCHTFNHSVECGE